MKTLCIIIVGIIFPMLGFTQVKISGESGVNPEKLKGAVKVMTSPELFEITTLWAEEFDALHDQMKVKVAIEEQGDYDRILPAGTDIRILYDDENTLVFQEGVTPIILGREVTVAVINTKNPYMEDLLKKGISNHELGVILNNEESHTWGQLLGTNEVKTVNIIISEDQVIQEELRELTGIEKNPRGITLGQDETIIGALDKDPYALAFCRMADVLDDTGKNFDENISLLPIDKNGNEAIDSHETFYDNYESFTRGVWIGKYPRELYRKIYSVSDANQTKESVVSFLEWIVTSGQESLISLGYDDIVYNEKRSNLNSLFIAEAKAGDSKNLYAGQKIFALIIALFIVTGLVGNFVARYLLRRRSEDSLSELETIPVFDFESIRIKKGFHFDKTHTWAFMDEDGRVKIGIDDFLQHVTGPITKIKMKMPGERINKGEKIFSIIQRGKRLNIYSPVSGIIKNHNDSLQEESSLVNNSPYTDGWIYVVEPTNWITEVQGLLMGQKYKNWLQEELLRLKDFLASSLNLKFYERAGLVLQEGGELKDGILDECGPEIWEEFQANFIDRKE